MAHSKIHLYTELLETDVPEDPYLADDLARYFPPPLPDRYPEQMRGHHLRRELIATIIANQLVDRAGVTFAFRLAEETSSDIGALARAYAVAREVFAMRTFTTEVEALDNQIEAGTQLAMLNEARRLVERATRWLVRSGARGRIDVAAMVDRFTPAAEMLAGVLPSVLRGQDRDTFRDRLLELEAAGVPSELARRVASMQALLSVFDIVVEAAATERPQEAVMDAYFDIGARLGLDWLRDRILELPRDDRWQALSRAALRDDLYRLHRSLVRDVFAVPGDDHEPPVEAWLRRNSVAVERSQAVLADIRASREYDTTTLPVALREFKNLLAEGEQLT
jgi:glutamate dehydrogenase